MTAITCVNCRVLLAALVALDGSLLQVDNGICGICRIGYRSYDTRGGQALDNCSNEACASHKVAAAILGRLE